MSGANAGAEPGATLVRPRLRILITNALRVGCRFSVPRPSSTRARGGRASSGRFHPMWWRRTPTTHSE